MENDSTELMQKQVENFIPIGAALMPGNLLRMREATDDEAERNRLLEMYQSASQVQLENTLEHRRSTLLEHLHRGGDYAYYWTSGRGKLSTWYRTDKPRPDVPGTKANQYFGVHPVSAIPPTNSKGKVVPADRVRSQIDYISAINCTYSEFDDKDFSDGRAGVLAHVNSINPPPSVIIDSGGGVHCYWLLSEPFCIGDAKDLQRAKSLQSKWVDFTGGDPGAKDLARVLRIPGTYNYKSAYGAPREVHFLAFDIGSTYAIDGLERVCQDTKPPEKPSTRRASHQINSGHPVGDVLSRLSSWRADDYRPWYQVGMCLAELGTEGFNLWDDWSRQSPKYNDPGNAKLMAYMWSKFKPGDGLTIASLYYWGKIDSGQGFTPELTTHQKALANDLPVPELAPPEETSLRLDICGVVIDKPGTLVPSARVGQRLVCGLNCCKFCATCKAQELRQRVLRAIDEFGFVHLLSAPGDKRRSVMRKIGAPNALCVPPANIIYVFNSVGQGPILLTEDNLMPLSWFIKLVMAIPDGKKRHSGDLGKELTWQEYLLGASLLADDVHSVHLLTKHWYDLEKSGQDSAENVSKDVGHGWVKTLATDATPLERDRLYAAAFETVQERVVSLYRVGQFEIALNMIMSEYELLLRSHGHRVATKSTVMTWHVTRMCDWIAPHLNRYELATTSSGTDPPDG